ncbi:MAG: hypothetical protein ACYCXA_06565 [Actinomycetes bacterium]
MIGAGAVLTGVLASPSLAAPVGHGGRGCPVALVPGVPGCPVADGGITNTGVVADDPNAPQPMLTDKQRADIAQMDRDRANAPGLSGEGSAGGVLPNMLPPAGAPATGTLANQALQRQEKTYTCGPAAARNMIQTLTGTDYGEGFFVTAMGTTTNGTSSDQIRNALNAKFPGWGTWSLSYPKSASDVIRQVYVDVAQRGRGVIQNVYTLNMPYSIYAGHGLWHFNLSYGFDYTGVGYVQYAEQWDPSKFYSKPGYASYGKWKIQAAELYTGISQSINKAMVG